LPDNWTPADTICAVVTIPDDPQYRSMLVGLVDILRWSALYERDDTKTGAATVSRTWEAALNSASIIFVPCEEVADMFDVRQPDAAPCTLEKTDDGIAWSVWANLQRCPPTLQAAPEPGGPPIWWNPDCDGGVGCWEPIPLPEEQEGYDPAYDDPQTPIEDGFVEPGNDPECVYATNVVEAFRSIYERVDYGLYVGALAVALWALLNTVVLMFLTKKARQLVQTLVALATFSYSDWHADYIGFDWQALIDMIACVFNDDGTVREDDFAEMLVKLGAETSPVFLLTFGIATLVGPVGFNNAADFAGITAATCTPDCSLALATCWDLTLDDGGFLNVGDYGHWTNGVGWVGDLNAGAGRYEIDVHTEDVPAGTIDYMRIEWNTTASPKLFQVFNGVTKIYEVAGGNAGFRWAAVTVGGALTDLRIRILQGTYNTTLLLTKVCFYRA
jgi:hypothetical protein